MDQGRKALGDRVRAERTASSRWRNREDFARDCGVSKRTIARLEVGEHVGDEVIAVVEATLGWEPGSANRVRRGLKPRRTVDEHMARLLQVWPHLSDDRRAAVVDIAEKFL